MSTEEELSFCSWLLLFKYCKGGPDPSSSLFFHYIVTLLMAIEWEIAFFRPCSILALRYSAFENEAWEKGSHSELASGQRTSGFSQKLRTHPKWFNVELSKRSFGRSSFWWSQTSGRSDYKVVPVTGRSNVPIVLVFFRSFRFRSLQTKESKEGKRTDQLATQSLL